MRIFSQTTQNWTCAAVITILSFCLLVGAPAPVSAEDLATAAQDAVLAPSECPLVRILDIGQPVAAASECYIITPGLGGMVSEDRFHQLAETMRKRFPQAKVLLVDWSPTASAKVGGFPNPWKVATKIDEVGDQAAVLLKKMEVDPARTILIGESFGSWVNARIARQLGGVQGILALNPANGLGGYAPPDLRKHAKCSYSFHTYSAFDTTLEIADSDFWLETPSGANDLDRHIAGISWLAARIEAGDHSWLQMDKQLPERRAGHFRATATIDGQLSDLQQPRQRRAPAAKGDRSADQLATDIAVAAP